MMIVIGRVSNSSSKRANDRAGAKEFRLETIRLFRDQFMFCSSTTSLIGRWAPCVCVSGVLVFFVNMMQSSSVLLNNEERNRRKSRFSVLVACV